MSAYVVNPATITVLVAAAHQHQIGWRTSGNDFTRLYPNASRGDLTRVGQMLLDQNVRSVNHRYQETADAGMYRYQPAAGLPGYLPGAVASAIDCYVYQACEDPGWPTSEAYKFCEALRCRLLEFLPGYGDAPWDWTQADLANQAFHP
jgi:hypothetical protein